MRVGSAPVGKPAARHREEVNQPPPMTTTVTLTPSSLPSILPHAMAVIQYFSATHIAFTARSLAKVQRIRKSYCPPVNPTTSCHRFSLRLTARDPLHTLRTAHQTPNNNRRQPSNTVILYRHV